MKHSVLALFFLSAILGLTSFHSYGQIFGESPERQILNRGDVTPDMLMLLDLNKTGEVISIPQKTWFYGWSDDEWELIRYVEISYTDFRKSDTVIFYDSLGGTALSRFTFQYNEFHLETLFVLESYVEEEWVPTNRIETKYDIHLNVTENTQYIFNFGNWQIFSGKKHTYTYNGNSMITVKESQSYIALVGWKNDSKLLVDFDNQLTPGEIILQAWDSEMWVNDLKRSDIDWKEYDGKHAEGTFNSFIQSNWINNEEWEYELKQDLTWSSDYSYELIEQAYNAEEWVNSLREVVLFDDYQKPLEATYFEWVDGAWEQVDGEKYLYTYEDDDLLELISQEWEPTSGLVNVFKEVYDDFLHFENINENPRETVFSIYPNPASDQVTIEYTGAEEPQMMLMNICGQVVMEKKLRSGANQVNTGHLSQGVYIMLIFKDNLLMGSHKLIRR
jgi:hypothetical protein